MGSVLFGPLTNSFFFFEPRSSLSRSGWLLPRVPPPSWVPQHISSPRAWSLCCLSSTRILFSQTMLIFAVLTGGVDLPSCAVHRSGRYNLLFLSAFSMCALSGMLEEKAPHPLFPRFAFSAVFLARPAGVMQLFRFFYWYGRVDPCSFLLCFAARSVWPRLGLRLWILFWFPFCTNWVISINSAFLLPPTNFHANRRSHTPVTGSPRLRGELLRNGADVFSRHD